jgi:PIN domain nuclease of toxin-antitoxin system
MRILIDTHIYLAALSAPEHLSASQRSELTSLANVIYVSSVSIAEIMIKASLGKLSVDFDPVEATETMGFQPLNFSAQDAVLLKDLPFHHRDPFDRMLIAQSIAQRTRLMSNDRSFTMYDCASI